MSTTTNAQLPAEFADLEPFAAWILATENERYDRRLASTMEEMQAFYDAAFPRLKEAMVYMDRWPLAELPDDGLRLLQLMCSLVEVSFPVEVWRQPRVPDSGAAAMTCVRQPTP